jgi:hypothetical protein
MLVEVIRAEKDHMRDSPPKMQTLASQADSILGSESGDSELQILVNYRVKSERAEFGLSLHGSSGFRFFS